MAGVDVDNLKGSVGGTSGWRWKAFVCFVGERRDGDVVEVEKVIPF